MIDNEYSYIYFDHFNAYENQEPWEDEIDEVRRARGNAEKWIEAAKQEMLSLCCPLYSNIADRETYPKHYPRFKESNESIKKRSQIMDAILLPEYTIDVQNFIFTKLLELRFPIILKNKDSVFIVERKKLTGFSEGNECTKLVCKINITSKLVHFYPVHENEFYKYEKVYPNPFVSDPLFELIEYEDNDYLKGDVLSNLVEISD